MKRKKILVTGGAGFIGSNFIRHILNRPRSITHSSRISVINLDRLTYSGNLDNLRDLEGDKRYRFIKGDICDAGLVSKLARQCDMIINFAAESHVDRSIRDCSDFIRTNIQGTQILLDAVRQYKVKRFVHISTDEVYGSIQKGYSGEKDHIKPNSPYAASKAAADLLVRSYYITYKLPVIITRSSNNFGPYQYPEKMIPLFITNALEGKRLPLYADGLNVRDWIYVEDNCDAVAFVTKKGKIGEVYNIGGDNERKNLELTKMILRILGKPDSLIKFVKDRPGHDKRYALNSHKLYKLGWRGTEAAHKKPGMSSVDSDFWDKLSRTVAWYKENGKWWKKLKKKKEKFW